MADTLSNLSNVPVEVLCLSSTPPLIEKARITCCESGVCEVLLDKSETALQAGMQVVLNSGPDNTLRIMGVVVEMAGSRMRVKSKRVVRPDKRSFPRIYGGVHVRYQVLSGPESEARAAKWLAGNDGPASKGTWWEPDPFMDFSGSGLKFQDQLRCKVYDLLLLDLQVAPHKDHWHATARVVRVEPLPPDDLDVQDMEQQKDVPTHQIAVHFEELPQKAREALADFTLRIQNALLRV